MSLRNTQKRAWRTVRATCESAFIYSYWGKPLLTVALRHSYEVDGFVSPGRPLADTLTTCGPGRGGDAQLPSPQV